MKGVMEKALDISQAEEAVHPACQGLVSGVAIVLRCEKIGSGSIF